MLNLALPHKVLITKTGLEFSPDIKFKDWEIIGEKLKTMNGFIHFWIGDWLNFGEAKYGEMYSQAMDKTHFAYGTLANDKWVASRIPLERRRENLSFEHHKEVAEFEADDQELLLEKAVENSLNRTKFRSLVYQYKLRLDMPEMTEEQIKENQKPDEDFKVVQPIINMGIDYLERLDSIINIVSNSNARDYLYSHLRDVVKITSKLVIEHEKQKHSSQNVD